MVIKKIDKLMTNKIYKGKYLEGIIYYKNMKIFVVINYRGDNYSILCKVNDTNFKIGVYMMDKFNKDVLEIEAMSSTSEISGKDQLVYIEDFSKYIGIKGIILEDGSMVTCIKDNKENSLAFLQLLKYSKTWYQRMGYKLQPNTLGKMLFTSNEKAKKIIKESLRDLRNYKINTFVKELLKENLILKNRKDISLKFITTSTLESEIYNDLNISNINSKIDRYISINNQILNIVSNYKYNKKTIFSDYLLMIYDTDCSDYNKLYKLLKSKKENLYKYNSKTNTYEEIGSNVTNLFLNTSIYFDNNSKYFKKIKG